MEMQRLRDEQDQIREENIIALDLQKAKLDATFQAIVVMEMNKAIQSASFGKCIGSFAQCGWVTWCLPNDKVSDALIGDV
ncbi:hypothetical protein M0R45_004892 [Rubus argutus]|uniref:Uncharacterized protein n=1 Tax=Rubus argutus TaxID=59490 RepID=A0AAW1YKW9_RUBAR